MRTFLFTAAALLLSGCSQPLPAHSQLNHFYDYQAATPSGKPLELNALSQQLKEFDVILVGEWHTHSGVHRFQADLLASLYRQSPNVALAMEQFTRDKQPQLDAYLKSEIGEQTLIKKGNAWPNYEPNYRPLVEFAKAHQLDVLAANAPKPIVQCIGRNGISYLEKLPASHRAWLASEIYTGDSPYKEKFMASMHHGKPEQTKRQYAAQVSWDETMAESIVNYLADHPGYQVMLTAGKFHTEQGLGTAASVLRRNPELKVAVITPVTELTASGGDYQLKVLPMPERYVSKAAQMEAWKALSYRGKDLVCEP